MPYGAAMLSHVSPSTLVYVAMQVGTGTTVIVRVEEISGKQIGVLVPTPC